MVGRVNRVGKKIPVWMSGKMSNLVHSLIEKLFFSIGKQVKTCVLYYLRYMAQFGFS
jgi:hypothetical protein